jgi:zinc transporter ZupT
MIFVSVFKALNHLVEAIMNRERTRRQKTFLKMDKKTESDNTQISIKCDAKEKSHHNQDPVAINSETKNTSLLQQQKQQSPSRQSKSDISEEIVIDNSNLPTLPLTNHSAFATQTTFDTWNFDVNVCCSTHDPVKNLENLHTMAKKLEMDLERKAYEDSTKRVVIQQQDQEIMSTTISSKQYSENNPGLEEDIAMKNIVENDIENMSNEFNITLQQNDITNDQTCDKDITLEQIEQHEANETQNDIETKKIMQMSINTTIAIALHNFPEGLATFVATLNDPKVGAVLAFAIAIHNIPEGICVSLPLYYATGNRRQAFLYGALSGVSEPIAAVIGFAILANAISDVMYAILFGIVAGMMVIISIRELLPTAHRYDPEDHVVTNSFILGMSIMALSLVFLVK